MELDLLEQYEITLGTATYRGCPLEQSELTRIMRRHTTMKRVKGMLHEDYDAAGASWEIFDRTLHEWSGVTSGGKPVECTTEAKKAMFAKHNDKAGEILETFDEARAKHREELEGN